MSQTEIRLNLENREIILIGTAHISKESCEEVTDAILREKPDRVAIELDEQRYKSLNDSENWRNLDISKVLKNHQGFLLLANLVLASFQRRMGNNVGIKPGDEMRAADSAARSLSIPVEMVDRPIQITLRRAWAKNSLWGKCKLLSALLASAFEKEEISSEQIEELKNKSEMDSMMSELADFMPTVKKVLIDERDRYLASKIFICEGKKIVAILGAGHLPGVQKHIENLFSGIENSDVSDIASVPQKKIGSKITGWIIPIIIVLLIGAGFFFGGVKKGSDMLGSWVIWNSLLAGIGTIAAAGHPAALFVAVVGAPFTSLCPLVGVGMFTGLAQAFFKKPKVSDMESVQDDVASIKGFYKNRILRVLLVFVLSSLGSALGTFIAGASFIKSISAFLADFVGNLLK